MPTTFHNTVPQLINVLTCIDKFLSKAEAHAETKKYDVNNWLQSRLAPDMYPLVKQVQIAGDMAKNGVARLAGQEPLRFEDNEATVAELRQRIKKTVSYLESFKPEDFKGCEDRTINLPWAAGKHMVGCDYINQMMLPNVYFHTAMTYAILRAGGVDLGKVDFIGQANIRG